MNNFDVAIVGGGIAGLSATREALDRGLKVVLFERSALGGKAINGGDIYLNLIYKLIDRNPNSNMAYIFDQANKELEKLSYNYTHFNNENLLLVNHEAKIMDNKTIVSNNKTYYANNIIIATGNKINIPKIEGIENALDSKFLIYPIFLNEIISKKIKKVGIIGAGRIAFEVATILSHFKIETHIFARGKTISHLDLETKNIFVNKINNKYLHIHENTNMISIKDNKFYFNDTSDKFDKIVLAAGFSFNNEILENLNLEYNKHGINVDHDMKTNIDNIFAIGDANSNLKFSNIAISEARTSVHHILGYFHKPSISYNHRILGVYEYAYSGLNEEELKDKNILYEVIKIREEEIDFNYNEISFVKVLIDKFTRAILGVFIVAKEATTVLNALNLIFEESIEDTINSKIPIFTGLYYVASEIKKQFQLFDENVIEKYFVPYFQPKVDQNKKIIGAEVLARFIANDRILSPLPYINNFETNGLISRFDLKVLEESLEIYKNLKDNKIIDKDFSLSVNMSSHTIDTISYPKLLELYNKHEIGFDEVLLEITERKTYEGDDYFKKITKLKNHGFKISMDDFSIGNSNFEMFYNLEFDEIKLDMNLLPKDESKKYKETIYINTINSLKLKDNKLVAEGIETNYHFKLAKENGVNYFQGYYLYKPLNLDDLKQVIKKSKENR